MTTPDVDGAEILYRQVGPGGTPIYYDPNRAPCLWTTLFLPTRGDTDGLSLIRSMFRSAVWCAVRTARPDVRYCLAPLVANKVSALATGVGLPSLTFLPTPDDLDERYGEPYAHCVIQQINVNDYNSGKEAKKRFKEWAQQVASSIQCGDILGPFEYPTEDQPYRPT